MGLARSQPQTTVNAPARAGGLAGGGRRGPRGVAVLVGGPDCAAGASSSSAGPGGDSGGGLTCPAPASPASTKLNSSFSAVAGRACGGIRAAGSGKGFPSSSSLWGSTSPAGGISWARTSSRPDAEKDVASARRFRTSRRSASTSSRRAANCRRWPAPRAKRTIRQIRIASGTSMVRATISSTRPPGCCGPDGQSDFGST